MSNSETAAIAALLAPCSRMGTGTKMAEEKPQWQSAQTPSWWLTARATNSSSSCQIRHPMAARHTGALWWSTVARQINKPVFWTQFDKQPVSVADVSRSLRFQQDVSRVNCGKPALKLKSCLDAEQGGWQRPCNFNDSELVILWHFTSAKSTGQRRSCFLTFKPRQGDVFTVVLTICHERKH